MPSCNFARRLADDGASATEIQALLGHESLNTSQCYIDATASRTRQAARANRTYRTVEKLARSTVADGRKTSKRTGPHTASLEGRPG